MEVVDLALTGTISVVHFNRLHLKRSQMPQVKDLEGFLTSLRLNRIHYEHTHLHSTHVHPTQNEINLDKVMEMMHNSIHRDPIIVSSNHHILDGHHRWYKEFILQANLEVVVVHRTIHNLIHEVQAFNSLGPFEPI